jgi:hypothetical protein
MQDEKEVTPLFRIPFTLYFLCIEYLGEEWERKWFLCLARKKFSYRCKEETNYTFEKI